MLMMLAEWGPHWPTPRAADAHDACGVGGHIGQPPGQLMLMMLAEWGATLANPRPAGGPHWPTTPKPADAHDACRVGGHIGQHPQAS